MTDKKRDEYTLEELKQERDELANLLVQQTEHIAGGEEIVICCRCGQTRKSKNTFLFRVDDNKLMCWLCARKHIRGLELRKIEAETERDAAQARVKEWEGWYEGLLTDFDGVTDNANDPSRLHCWDWLEENRPTPESEADDE